MISKEELIVTFLVVSLAGLLFGSFDAYSSRHGDCAYHSIVDYSPYRVIMYELLKERW